MRARLAILKSVHPVILRNITLSNKPIEMLAASPKGTVPILIVSPKLVIEESLEIMLWTLGQNDPSDLLHLSFRT
jgi:glutathione S-transferase